jgi:single-strand DNA-binding protein
MSVNKVILIGNVGKDPEVKYLEQDVPVAKFTLATSESYKAKNGEKVETTEWHNIVLWRGLAKIAEQYVRKGSKLFIEGKITHRQYEQDGVTKFFTEIVGNNMEMLSSKSDDNRQGAGQYNQNQNSTGSTSPVSLANEPEIDEPGGDEDLPF